MKLDLLRLVGRSGLICQSPAPPLLAEWMLENEVPPVLTFWAWDGRSGGLALLRDGSPVESFGWPVLRTYFQHPLVAAFWGSKLLKVSPSARTGPVLLLHNRVNSQIQAYFTHSNGRQHEVKYGPQLEGLLRSTSSFIPRNNRSLYGQPKYWERASECKQWLDRAAFTMSCSVNTVEVLGQKSDEFVL
jgi:hypothetical protein